MLGHRGITHSLFAAMLAAAIASLVLRSRKDLALLFGVAASRTRILVAFTSAATISQANGALSAAGVSVAGGLPRLGLLLVVAPDSPDFSGLIAAIDRLRADPAIQTAAMSTAIAGAAIPPPATAPALLAFADSRFTPPDCASDDLGCCFASFVAVRS